MDIAGRKLKSGRNTNAQRKKRRDHIRRREVRGSGKEGSGREEDKEGEKKRYRED